MTKSVTQVQLDKAYEQGRKDERERIESHFDYEPTHCTFVKTHSVEECYTIRTKDWQTLKKG